MIVASAEYNFLYGDQIHCGYSIACVISAARAAGVPMTLLPTAVQRDCFDEHVERCAAADVLLCSCYVWNWEITNALARAVKWRNPRCLVVFGGPQVPDTPGAEWYAAHPWVEACVHGEGEGVLDWVLSQWMCSSVPRSIRGRSMIAQAGYSTQMQPVPPSRWPRLQLDDVRSPYLDGTIDELAEPLRDGRRWIAALETNRGCFAGCRYCDWGSATYTKLRQFSMERVLGEIEWFGQHDVPYIDCCDANFGILPRDRDIAHALAMTKAKYGSPQTFRQSWLKNSSEKLIAIAKELHDAGLLTAAGLALESLDDTTLKTIQRRNLPFDKYADLSKQFADAGLPTYTELIRGLPGETLDSFTRGLGALIDDAHIGQIYVYNCSVLPNAPMADPAYIAEHGIKTVRSPIYLAHSAVNSTDIQEYEDIVTETATMPRADMEQACLYSWVVALGESLGLCDQLSAWYARPHGATRIAFYGALLAFCQLDGVRTVLGDEYRRAAEHARHGYDGDGWGEYAPELGEMLWPVEEASWLTLVGLRRDETCLALSGFLRALGHSEPMRAVVDQLAQLEQFDGDDFAAWARDMMWFGRRSQRFRRTGIRKAA